MIEALSLRNTAKYGGTPPTAVTGIRYQESGDPSSHEIRDSAGQAGKPAPKAPLRDNPKQAVAVFVH